MRHIVMTVDIRAWRPARSLVLTALLTLAACNLPQDPDETTESVRGGELSIGVIEGSSYASFPAEGAPQGEEVELAHRVASAFSAEPRWVRGTADQIFAALEDDQIDLAIGGIAASTPWTSHAAMSAPVGQMELGGETVDRVFALPLGENRWMLEVNRIVRDRRGSR